MPLQYRLQQLLVHPNVSYLLLLAGVLGLTLELLSPELVGPGLFGAVALLLGLYGTAQLPVSAAGVALLVLGVGLLGVELAMTSGGLRAGASALALAAAGRCSTTPALTRSPSRYRSPQPAAPDSHSRRSSRSAARWVSAALRFVAAVAA